MNTLRHHLNYLQKQVKLNDLELKRQQLIDATSSSIYSSTNNKQKTRQLLKKSKVLPNSNASKIRYLVNERIRINDVQQIDNLREYSHYLCRKKLDKLDNDLNNKLNNALQLPFITNNNNK